MKDRNGIFSLAAISAICVCVLAAGAVFLAQDTKALTDTHSTVNEYVTQLPSIPSEIPSSSSSSATQVSAGSVIGKVTQSFIAPYKSNTSYNKVYINNKTDTPINIASLLSQQNPIKIQKNSDPQVLIVHTHATECYLNESKDHYTDKDLSRTTDNTKNMVAIGNIFEKKLNGAGIKTLHDSTAHDYPAYSGSYTRSKATIEKYLKQYPSIKIVIDLHRDSIGTAGGDKVKPIVEINGKKAAQVMLVMGCGANISGHKDWKQNLIFAGKYQQTMEVLYPGLARAISLVNSRYNQNLTHGSILIEVGTDSNSFEEAKYGAELASNALLSYLNTLC